jgi:hypothetical protein
MGLYLCLVLAAEFAFVEEAFESKESVLAVIWGTTLGLTVAHIFAFNLSARIFEGGRLSAETRMSIVYQVVVAIGVAALLSLPLLLANTSTALNFGGYVIAGVIGLIGFTVARLEGGSPVKSAAFAVVMVAAAVLVVLLKSALSH